MQRRIFLARIVQQETDTRRDSVERRPQVGQCLEVYHRAGNLDADQLVGHIDEVLRREGVLHQYYLPHFLGLAQLPDDPFGIAAELYLRHHPGSQHIVGPANKDILYLIKRKLILNHPTVLLGIKGN